MYTSYGIAKVREAMAGRGTDLATTRDALIASAVEQAGRAAKHRAQAARLLAKDNGRGIQHSQWAETAEHRAAYIETHIGDEQWLEAMTELHKAQNSAAEISLYIAERWPLPDR